MVGGGEVSLWWKGDEGSKAASGAVWLYLLWYFGCKTIHTFYPWSLVAPTHSSLCCTIDSIRGTVYFIYGCTINVSHQHP